MKIMRYGEKRDTHIRGQLHRAFSVFIFDPENKTMLLQKRAKTKYHSGGLWSNACCSHPRKGETWDAALSRCLKEELGIVIESETGIQESVLELPECVPIEKKNESFEYVGDFQYYSQYGNLAEHELDEVFVYCRNFREREIPYNPDEVEQIQWVHLEELEQWMEEHPEQFTSWFSPAYKKAKTKIQEKAFTYEKVYINLPE